MECLESFANIVGNLAEWANVFVTIAAVGAAFWAAHWAKKAWVAQEKQSIASRRQLRLAYKQQKMALEQEKRALAVTERDRRAMSPLFRLVRFRELQTIEKYGQVSFNCKDLPIFGCDFSRTCYKERVLSKQPFYILVENVRPSVILNGWKVQVEGLTKPEMWGITAWGYEYPSHLVGCEGWFLIECPVVEKDSEIKVFIEFETAQGHHDTHEYVLTICSGETPFPIDLTRISPSSVHNPDQKSFEMYDTVLFNE